MPAPSYPLFSYLAGLESVRVRTYPLVREEGFRIDVASVAASIGSKTRAIVVVHPNNPTGTFALEEDARAIETLAADSGLAILSDEVFRGYA